MNQMKNNSNPVGSVSAQNEKSEETEMRPGGMLVQKRDDDEDSRASSSGPMITINVSHGSAKYDLHVPANTTTFGDLKKILAQKVGLQPEAQRLLFRGKEKDDEEQLHEAGVKDMSKVLLFGDPPSKESKLDHDETNESSEISKASQEVAGVRAEVDKLSERIAALEAAVDGGTKLADKEFEISTELLMRELLKLDGIEAEGEAKMQRKAEVRRIQSYVDALDALKARNSNPFSNNKNAVSVSTEWETFDSGVGSLTAPPPMPPSVRVTQDWEHFD